MLTIVNFLRGYLEVEITGPYPERFVNICSQNGISFWQLDRIAPDRLMARVRVLEYDRLKELSKNALCEVKTVSRKGAPFFVMRFRKRYLFIAGFLISAFALYFLSQRIWAIEVVGNKSVSDERIIKTLEEMGIGIGTPSSQIDPESIENQILLKIKELRWMTVNVHGSQATVDVRERTEPPALYNAKIPCNIVAAKAGIISKIDVLEGAAQVAVGDTVKEGQLIASGVVDTAVGARLVHAMANVKANTWYTLSARIPRLVDIKTYTGEIRHKSALIVAGNRINMYLSSSISYDRCDNMIWKNQWTLPGGFTLPFTWVSEEYREYTVMPGQLDGRLAEEILRENLLARLSSLVGDGEIRKTDFVFSTDKGSYVLTLRAQCIENIEKTVEIPILNHVGG